jgi:hypothetical protein
MKGAGRVIQLLVHAIVQGIVHAPTKQRALPVTKLRVTPATGPTPVTHPRSRALSSEGVPTPIELPEERIVSLPRLLKQPVFKRIRTLASTLARAHFCEATFEANKLVKKQTLPNILNIDSLNNTHAAIAK